MCVRVWIILYLRGQLSVLHLCVLLCVGQDGAERASQVFLLEVRWLAHQRGQRHGDLHLHSREVLRWRRRRLQWTAWQFAGGQLSDGKQQANNHGYALWQWIFTGKQCLFFFDGFPARWRINCCIFKQDCQTYNRQAGLERTCTFLSFSYTLLLNCFVTTRLPQTAMTWFNKQNKTEGGNILPCTIFILKGCILCKFYFTNVF